MQSLLERRICAAVVHRQSVRNTAAVHLPLSRCKSVHFSPYNRATTPLLQTQFKTQFSASQKRFLASSAPQPAPKNDQEEPADGENVPEGEMPLSKLSTDYFTLPNVITLARMASAPAIGYLIVADKPMLACAATLVAAATDWLDGYIAKRFNQQSVFGTFLDPLADKFMVSSLVIALAIRGALPNWLVGLILTRDVALVVAAVGLRWYLKPKGAGFWDTSTATFRITPNLISKVNTFLQFGLISGCLLEAAIGVPPVTVLEPLGYVVGATTLASGLSYINGSGLLQLKKLKEARKKNQ